MLGIPLGLAWASLSEWVVHRYVLHDMGKKKGSFWSFHWHEHHKNSRQRGFKDPAYERSLWEWNSQSKEALALAGSALLYVPLLPIAPFFTATVWYSIANYYRVHKKSHLDPEWAREHLPWHYDHHMGPDQNCNWGVSRPWADAWLGTRKPYAGTEREARDIARRAARKARKKAASSE